MTYEDVTPILKKEIEDGYSGFGKAHQGKAIDSAMEEARSSGWVVEEGSGVGDMGPQWRELSGMAFHHREEERDD
jgi:hypothetical protein